MKFKITLQGNSEFTAFCDIVKAVMPYYYNDFNSVEALNDYCYYSALNQLLLKLAQKAINFQMFKKKITVNIDTLQGTAIYNALVDDDFDLIVGTYERNLALRIVDWLQQQYFNSVALFYASLSVSKNMNLLPSGANKLLNT